MYRRKRACTILAVCAGTLVAGCMPQMTLEEMQAQRPRRPAELDRLDAFVGKWQYEGQARMPMIKDRESLRTAGTGEYRWDGDRWFVVGRGVMSMEGFDDMQSLETWTYDAKAGKFRSTWTGSQGMIGIGEGRYDAKTDTWHIKATSYSPWGRSTMKGWMKFSGADTMEWWWAEYQGLMKTMEMSGTGKRVK